MLYFAFVDSGMLWDNYFLDGTIMLCLTYLKLCYIAKGYSLLWLQIFDTYLWFYNRPIGYEEKKKNQYYE